MFKNTGSGWPVQQPYSYSVPSPHNVIKFQPRGPILEAAMGAMNREGTECGIESPIAYETSILEAGIEFSSSTRALSFFLRKMHIGGIDFCEESIPSRYQFLLRNQCLGRDYQ